MPKYSKQELNKKFTQMKADGVPIVGGGAGTGLSAKCEEQGGIDLIVIYNSGRYRMAGRGSLSGLLAYGNANEIVKEMAAEVIPVTESTPVLAGVNGTDPFCNFDMFLDDLQRLGFSGMAFNQCCHLHRLPTLCTINGHKNAKVEMLVVKTGHQRFICFANNREKTNFLRVPISSIFRPFKIKRRHNKLPYAQHGISPFGEGCHNRFSSCARIGERRR